MWILSAHTQSASVCVLYGIICSVYTLYNVWHSSALLETIISYLIALNSSVSQCKMGYTPQRGLYFHRFRVSVSMTIIYLMLLLLLLMRNTNWMLSFMCVQTCMRSCEYRNTCSQLFLIYFTQQYHFKI